MCTEVLRLNLRYSKNPSKREGTCTFNPFCHVLFPSALPSNLKIWLCFGKDWDDDEVDADAQSVDDDPENCAVDENFDPEAAVNEETDGGRVRSSSGPILIGPLTFDDDPVPEDDDLMNEKPEKNFTAKQNEKHHHHLASHYRYFSSRQFSGGTRGTTMQRNHGLCLSLSDHDRIKIFVHELCNRGLLQYIEKLMRYLNEQVLHTCTVCLHL